ncbi:MAG: class I SAM-dependent methyltransferase [Terriglobales bacterium]
MSIKNYFQQSADRFDALYDEGSRWRRSLNRLLRPGLQDRIQLTLEELRGLQDFTLLDIGCGSGRNSVRLAQTGARHVTGVDFSPRMIELATEFSRAQGASGKCEFIEADFLTLPMEKKFDVVVALGVLDYMEDSRGFLERMAALARKRLIASFPGFSLVRAPLRKLRYSLRGCPVYFYSADFLEKCCRDLGFPEYRVVPYRSSGLLLVARLDRFPAGHQTPAI